MEYSIDMPLNAAASFISRIRLLMTRAIDKLHGSERRDRVGAFDRIVRQHDDLISRLCFGYSHSKEEFEDLRQDVYVNIWQGLDKFRGDSSPKTWIYRVTLNTCVSTIRKRPKDSYKVELTEVADVSDDTEYAAQLIAELYQSIGTLSPIDKAIIMLWLDQLSYEEIADAVGLSKNAVATRVHRIKVKLKKMI